MRHAIALAAVLALVLGACGPSPSPSETATGSAPPPSVEPATAAPPTLAPETTAPTDVPTPTDEPSVAPSVAPSGGPQAPSVDSLKIKRYADCASDNGTGQVGYVKITWTASGTSGVRISIDPPSPGDAYDSGYADYPVSGSAEVPFACDPPNHDASGDYHLYVVTTLHTKGAYYYRYARVYQIVVESPAP